MQKDNSLWAYEPFPGGYKRPFGIFRNNEICILTEEKFNNFLKKLDNKEKKYFKELNNKEKKIKYFILKCT